MDLSVVSVAFGRTNQEHSQTQIDVGVDHVQLR